MTKSGHSTLSHGPERACARPSMCRESRVHISYGLIQEASERRPTRIALCKKHRWRDNAIWKGALQGGFVGNQLGVYPFCQRHKERVVRRMLCCHGEEKRTFPQQGTGRDMGYQRVGVS